MKLQTKKKKDSHTHNKKAKEDPLVRLGFGICAYRDIVWSLIWTFILFSLLMIPAINLFDAGTAYATLNPALAGKEDSTLGNLGYSTVACLSMPVEVGSIAVSCPYGVIGKVYSFGVTNTLDGNPLD